MRNPRGLAYIDTNILLMMIDYKTTPNQEFRKYTDKLLYDYKIKIPQIVVGESIAIHDKTSRQEIQRYADRVESVFGKATFDFDRFPPANNEVITEAQELSKRSDVINDMDSLILAHVIVDNDATHFFTTDKSFNNERIVDRIRFLQDQGIRDKDLNIPVVLASG